MLKNVTYIRLPSSHKLPSLNHYIKLHKRSSSHFFFFCKIRAALPARRVIKLFASAFVFFSQYSQRKNGKSCARPSCRLSFTLGCPDCMRCRRIYLCASGGQCAKCEKNIISALLKNLLLLLLFGCSLSLPRAARAFIYKSNELSSSLVGKKCFIILNPTHKYTHTCARFLLHK
jgi:hypothetical protein